MGPLDDANHLVILEYIDPASLSAMSMMSST